MIEKIRNEQTDALCKAFASLKTVEECYKFLDDLCTLSEVTEMGKRLSAARMLREGITYNEIAVRTGCPRPRSPVSTARCAMAATGIIWCSTG